MRHFQYVQLLQLLAFKICSTAGSLMLGAPAGIQSAAGTFIASSDICLGAFCLEYWAEIKIILTETVTILFYICC